MCDKRMKWCLASRWRHTPGSHKTHICLGWLERTRSEVDVDFSGSVFREIQYSCVESGDNWHPKQRFRISQKLHHISEIWCLDGGRISLTSISKPPRLLPTVKKKSFCLVYTMYQSHDRMGIILKWSYSRELGNANEFLASRHSWRLFWLLLDMQIR